MFWALLAVWSFVNQAESCNYTYTAQPPSSLGCNPLGIQLLLTCATDPLPQSATLNWYWTQNVSDAGVNGTPILPGDTYMVTAIAQTFVQRDLRFTVTNSTLGYYWCEIGNVTDVLLRPTTITPVCSTGSSQLMNCNDTENIANMHVVMAMCAVINSPFSPSSLPAPCAAPLQISANPTTISQQNSFSLQSARTTIMSLSTTAILSEITVTSSVLSITAAVIPHTLFVTTIEASSSSFSDVTISPTTSSSIATTDSTTTLSTATSSPCIASAPNTSSAALPAVTTVCVLLTIVVAIETVVIAAILCTIYQRKKKRMFDKGNCKVYYENEKMTSQNADNIEVTENQAYSTVQY